MSLSSHIKKYARNAHSGQDLLHFRGPRKRAKMFLLSQDEFDTFSFLLLIKKSKNLQHWVLGSNPVCAEGF